MDQLIFSDKQDNVTPKKPYTIFYDLQRLVDHAASPWEHQLTPVSSKNLINKISIQIIKTLTVRTYITTAH